LKIENEGRKAEGGKAEGRKWKVERQKAGKPKRRDFGDEV
jgi:hypothetical protein